jgi:CO/xanthine dehydrogenase FAD-binding subunit
MALAELGGGIWDEEGVYIPSMTTSIEVAESAERFPLLAEAAVRVASPQIRKSAAYIGNILPDTLPLLSGRFSVLSSRRQHLFCQYS